MACAAREDKRNYISAFRRGTSRERCQCGVLTTGAVRCRQGISKMSCVFPNAKDKPIKANTTLMGVRTQGYPHGHAIVPWLPEIFLLFAK